ncbi:hypothetical protein T439DRAFT_321538 [Meredithblackwellia eburnea MCA 4105]
MSQPARILLKNIRECAAAGDDLQVDDLIDSLEAIATVSGLNDEDFLRLMTLIMGSTLAPKQVKTILTSAVPLNPISSNVVVLIISSLGENNAGSGLQGLKNQARVLFMLAELIRMGRVQSKALEELESLWAVIENGLMYQTLRDAAAQLLLLITKRHHVQAYRIHFLQDLIRKDTQNLSSLTQLLHLYRSYYPEFVMATPATKLKGGKKSSVPKVVQEWAETVTKVTGEGGDKLRQVDDRDAKRRKLGHVSLIPSGATFDAATTTIPLSDLSTLSSLTDVVDKLQLPSKAGAVLGYQGSVNEPDRTKTWGVILNTTYGSDPSYLHRLSSHLSSTLSHCLSVDDISGKSMLSEAEAILSKARDLSYLGGELVEPLDSIIAQLLETWDGEWAKDIIFGLVSLIPPEPFESLYTKFFSPLEKLARTADPEWLADLVRCFEELVQTWSERGDWVQSKSNLPSTFGRRKAEMLTYSDALGALQSVVSHVDVVIASAVQVYPRSIPLRSAGLSFYETTLLLPTDHKLPIVIIPSQLFTFGCLLSEDIMTVSRICGIIARLREALTGESSVIQKSDESNSETIEALNDYLVDFINTFWQRKFLANAREQPALNLVSTHSEVLSLLCEKRDQELSNALGLTVHGALAPMGIEFLAKLEKEQGSTMPANTGPVLAETLKDVQARGGPKISINEFRRLFLEHLLGKGAAGIHEFFFTSLQSLIKRRLSDNASQSQS